MLTGKYKLGLLQPQLSFQWLDAITYSPVHTLPSLPSLSSFLPCSLAPTQVSLFLVFSTRAHCSFSPTPPSLPNSFITAFVLSSSSGQSKGWEERGRGEQEGEEDKGRKRGEERKKEKGEGAGEETLTYSNEKKFKFKHPSYSYTTIYMAQVITCKWELVYQ